MAVYVPPPVRAGAADAGSLSAERWACGVAASSEEWPEDRFTWRLPEYGLPLRIDHEEEWIVPSGSAPGEVGAARRFADIGGLVAVLLEITAAPVIWDLAEGRRRGLSVMAHVHEPPGGGPAWVYFSEVSLTSRPKDPLARVVSTGRLALADWRALTGDQGPLLAEGS